MPTHSPTFERDNLVKSAPIANIVTLVDHGSDFSSFTSYMSPLEEFPLRGAPPLSQHFSQRETGHRIDVTGPKAGASRLSLLCPWLESSVGSLY